MNPTDLQALPATRTKKLVTIPLLSAVAFLLMYLEFPLPLIPNFLKLDFSTLPGLLGGLMFGPAAGITIELIKNILHLLLKNTDGLLVGEIANFVAGSSFIWCVVAMHRLNRDKGGVVVGLLLGTVLMTVLMSAANVYVLIPAYAALYQMSVANLLATLQLDSMWSLVMHAIAPFNVIKGLALSLITYPVYVKMAPRLGRG
ncbi:ECF transporter S component [Brevibacillus sp. SYP-B805]|uniref:ECF transporter S component n=1 Tax=Brevibacillus sp. SYP-B805 TaxID=1578199 RepID=UPI0013EA4597|nr:ECF transporter S component [Brevibacillus sp. SYP-B805]NGQ97368.1 ECF transporter S component [Brevibacillus sp. SYP-B805]